MARRVITEENLKCGIQFFESRPGWPGKDFHASFYRDLRKLRSSMFTPEWWEKIYQTNESGSLTKWRATRNARNDPRRKGLLLLGELRRAYNRIPDAVKESGFDSAACTEAVVDELFCIACKIKESRRGSVVFASKLCHFILPKAFPVIDNAALKFNNPGKEEYKQYWNGCRRDWRARGGRESLKTMLRNKIKAMNPDAPLADYPWSTKIAELCVMGQVNLEDWLREKS